MNGIEQIVAKILADSKAETQTVLDEAKAQANQVTARYAAEAEAEVDAITQRGEAAAVERQARLASMAQLEARKVTLTAKQDMVDKAFDAALTKLTALPQGEYVELLAKLAVEACVTGVEQVILSQKDRAQVGKAVVTRANELLEAKKATAQLTLDADTRDIAGGLILRNEKVETNCSFEVLIHLQKEALAAQVAKVLFG